VGDPYGDEELVAVPALYLDAAIVHLNRADVRGNGRNIAPDLFFDEMFLGAARRRFVSCEKIVPTDELVGGGPLAAPRIGRHLVDGVVEAPNGAHFTSCEPDYGRDEAFQREYAASAADADAWRAFRTRYVDLPSEADYQKAVSERAGVHQ
jgi:glutaconate CoA-transferase subunit A